MKISPALNVLLALALVVLSCKIAFDSPAKEPPVTTDEAIDSHSGATAKASGTYADIMTRSSVRAYTDAPVSHEAVDSLLRAAMAAPTAGNKQPWQFVVIDDRSLLQSLAADAPGWAPLKGAPLAVVACGDPALGFEGEAAAFWVQDLSAATENLLLAAHSMGLGAVWCGAFPIAERVESLRKALAIPDSVIPLNIIAIGHPATQPAPKEKYKAERVHINRY